MTTRLERFLQSRQPGLLMDSAREFVLDYLSSAWESFAFDGGDDAKMKAHKLVRAEKLRWAPPYIEFEVERHGGAVLGSKRAEIQCWKVNPVTFSATWTHGGFRQLQPNNPKLDVKPIVEALIAAILAGGNGKGFKRLSPSSVRMIIGEIIPANCPKQTLKGRRNRFKKLFAERMAESGWVPVKGLNTFEAKPR